MLHASSHPLERQGNAHAEQPRPGVLPFEAVAMLEGAHDGRPYDSDVGANSWPTRVLSEPCNAIRPRVIEGRV